ncbi:MAG TPA: hypothetical protein PL155_02570 [Candidatus Omnitrophota bacterium]|nr:hypothetical protein [Candidatus Omnitrophota bacterium]HPD84630.1 hypothetical protein [Candidatus Omnitrophota bacterium]HRZ03488.1 hypothetical protein [Candidatus Omnitrophota bacterium]
MKCIPKGQTASELAIFGAILIFVLGLIIRMALNFNYAQNQALGAMRLAFEQSFRSGTGGNASRMFSSILYIEDRKDADVSSSGRYLTSSRMPFVTSGAGAFTNNLFMPTQHDHPENLSIMDVFINGQHFTFTTAQFKTCNFVTGFCGSLPTPIIISDSAGCGNGPSGGAINCAKAYTRIVYGDDNFCSLNPFGCSPLATGDTRNTLEDRFNLDRNTLTQCAAVGCTAGMDVEPAQTDEFTWEWYAIPMTNSEIDFNDGKNTSLDVDGDLKEESIVRMVDTNNFTYTLKEPIPETIDWFVGDEGAEGYHNLVRSGAMFHAAFKEVTVIDQQEGDIDNTYDTRDRQNGKPQPGLKPESFLYVYGKPAGPGDTGTYLRVEEGKLFTPDTRQYVRQTRKQDSIEVIERQIQLSNDTGRMCNGSNPVEACCDAGSCCYSNDNVFKTCFDRSTKILHIRSKIEDRAKKKWVTDVSTDKNPFK